MKLQHRPFLIPLLLALAFFLHAFACWQTGTEGHDSIFYQRMGLQWAQGDFGFSCPGKAVPHFRPALFAVSGFFYGIFGIHDFSLKIMNLSSLAGICWLLLLCARRLKLSRTFETLPIFLFLFLPSVIIQSRIEMPHLLSGFFVMLSFFLLIRFRDEKKASHLILSALALHAAMATHEDLALLAPGFLLLLPGPRPFTKKNLYVSLKQAFIFTFFFFAPFLIYVLLWKPGDIWFILQYSRVYGPPTILNPEKHFPQLALELLTRGLVSVMGLPWVLLLYGSLAAALLSFFKNRRRPSGVKLLIPVFLYALLFNFLITRNNLEPLTRLLIPLIPLLGLFLSLQVQIWCQKPSRLRRLAAAGLVILAVGSNFMPFSAIPSFAFYRPSSPQPFYRYQTAFRYVHDQMKEKLGPGQKILIAPSSFSDHFETFNLPFYFNGNAVALNQCAAEGPGFDHFLRTHRIQIVFVGSPEYRDRRWPPAWQPFDGCLIPGTSYNAELESRNLLKALEPYEPVKMNLDDAYGTFHEIKIPENR